LIKRSLTIFFIIVISLFALLVSLEVCLRIIFADSFAGYRKWGHKKSILFGFEAAPNYHWEAVGASYNTDAFGFRKHTNDLAWATKEGGKIFVLGASSAFGYGLNDDETWPEFLEKKLQEKSHEPLYVINAANNGHTSVQTLLRFYLKVLPLKPDHILYYEDHNDVGWMKSLPTTVGISENILFSTSIVEYLAKEREHAPFYEKTLIYYVFGKGKERLLNHFFPKPEPPTEGELTEEKKMYKRRTGSSLSGMWKR
jgi:hypothetical protein